LTARNNKKLLHGQVQSIGVELEPVYGREQFVPRQPLHYQRFYPANGLAAVGMYDVESDTELSKLTAEQGAQVCP
jgi:hypothetical protein